MSNKIKQTLREEYNRLKKSLGKLVKPREQQMPQLVLQPIRDKRNLRGTDHR